MVWRSRGNRKAIVASRYPEQEEIKARHRRGGANGEDRVGIERKIEIKARHRRGGANGEDRVGIERKIELVHFADMNARLDGRPLVKGILEREQISVIFGEPGCGKTFLALDLALHVAADLPAWFDRAVASGATVYAAAEAGRGIINRVAAFTWTG